MAAVPLRSFSLSAYLNVLRVWSAELDPGQMQASITILFLSLWMKESLSTIVSFEALKGTCDTLLYFWASRALTHSLSAKRLWFISAPSCCLSLLLDWHSCALSLPAKSTNSNFPGVFMPSSWILIWQTAWLLLDVSLAFVAWVVLTLLPNWIN